MDKGAAKAEGGTPAPRGVEKRGAKMRKSSRGRGGDKHFIFNFIHNFW